MDGVDAELIFIALLCMVVVFLMGLIAGNGIAAKERGGSSFGADLNELKANDVVLYQGLQQLASLRVNESLCGVNQFIPDSNVVNQSPRGIVYSCFAPIREGVSS